MVTKLTKTRKTNANIKHYVNKPYTIDAVLWTGDNYSDVYDLTHGKVKFDGKKLSIEDDYAINGRLQEIKSRCYVIRYDKNMFEFMSIKNFKDNYIEMFSDNDRSCF